MFGLGLGEIFFIILAVIIFLEPQKIPPLIRFLGKGVGKLQKLANDLKYGTEKLSGYNEEEQDVKKDAPS